MICTQNTNKNENMFVLDLFLFSIFYNFHKKQEILVDNKIGNEKNKNNKKKKGQKCERYAKNNKKVKKSNRSTRTGQRGSMG